MKGRTYYSEKVRSARANYDWSVQFDITDGYVGITQFDGEMVKDRVLLSPAQVRELVNFTAGKKPKQAA